jgi:predicted AAA+ superfamily ATPase
MKSKKSINGEEKYFLSDFGFYFATNVDGRVNYGPVLENLVYNYAKSLRYELSVGQIGSLEVDFILRDPSGEYSYLQVARTIYGEEDENGVDRTQEREYRSLERIQDNYPKYILSLDYLLQRRSGILHKNIVDMMSKNEGFTGLN